MISETSIVQPYKSDDGDIDTLLKFLRTVTKIIDNSFNPPDSKFDKHSDSADYDFVEEKYKLGNQSIFFSIMHRMEFEAKYGGHAVDIVIIQSHGLSENQSISIEVSRRYSTPRFAKLSISVVDENISKKIIEMFQKEFDARSQLDETDIKRHVTSALVAVRRGAWSGAESHAKIVLDNDPNNAEALLYLGIARAAQGDLTNAEKILKEVLEKDPSNYDAYYNLGLVYKNSDRLEESVILYQKGLEVNPDNHAIQFQLARAYEEIGNKEKALFYYREALRTSPNPDGAFHYTGMDFTTHSKDGIARLEKELNGNDS
ncbi:MAG: tetratricopeptide repeat protein [Candidatus Lokiarchaeota archaeon]|nr:tetratricopeptide repeat protein [Candidatus Lokiarchaeota archaeon]